MAQPSPRSLADDLRSRDDDALADLLVRRPDLAVPPPTDLSSLAGAAAGRLSVQRAVDGLDAAALGVLEIIAALPEPTTAAEVGRRWGAAATVELEALRELALVWGGSRSLRLVRAARDVVGPYPAGLGPPLADALGRRSPQRLMDLLDDLGLPPIGDQEQALSGLAEHLGDAAVVEKLLDSAPEPVRTGARAVLDRLVWGPPVGQVEDADRPVRVGSAASPIEWLLAHGLLAVADPGHVVLPREVALALRGGRVFARSRRVPPEPATRTWPAERLAATAAQAAAEAVRLVEALCRTWESDPPTRLRGGGLAVRDLRRTATALDVDPETAGLIAEISLAAALIADDGEIDPRWLPTPVFDAWVASGTGERWSALAAGWLDSTRAASLIGSRAARGGSAKDAPVAALGPDVERPVAPELRRTVLAQLAGLGKPAGPAGTGADSKAKAGSGELVALSDPTGRDLVERLDWYSPRRTGRARAALITATLGEAAWLGLTGLGGMSPAGALVLLGDLTAAGDTLDAALPAPVEEVLLQADLTAVAPGRLTDRIGAEMALLAEIESRGAATVYRFTPDSVRRALDAGRTAEEMLNFLTSVSRTPVPQPLTYLVSDSARRYGRLRVGAAGAYLRADDESVLAELLADRRAAALVLRRLAPTVLASPSPPDVVLATLRSMGLAPAAESATGALLIPTAEARRASVQPRVRHAYGRPPAMRREDLLLAVRTMRAVEDNARRPVPTAPAGGPPDLVPMDPAGSLAMIRDAVAARRDVWIGYLESAGQPVRHIVEPLAVEAGRVRALDRETGLIRHYSVHRLIGVAPV